MEQKRCVLCGKPANYSLCANCDKKTQNYDLPAKIRIPGSLEYMMDKILYHKPDQKLKKPEPQPKYFGLEKIASNISYKPFNASSNNPAYKAFNPYNIKNDASRYKHSNSYNGKKAGYALGGSGYQSKSASKSGYSSSGKGGAYK